MKDKNKIYIKNEDKKSLESYEDQVEGRNAVLELLESDRDIIKYIFLKEKDMVQLIK